MSVRERVRACVCVRERERDRDRYRDREKEGGKEDGGEGGEIKPGLQPPLDQGGLDLSMDWTKVQSMDWTKVLIWTKVSLALRASP